MAVMDEFKVEREAIKNGTSKEKFQYFLDYYKWQTITAIAVIIIIISSIYSAVTAKETLLSGVMLNCYHSFSEEPFADLIHDFISNQQINSSKYEIELNTTLTYSADNASASETNYNTIQLLGAQIASHSLDFVAGNLEAMTTFAYSDSFCDLSSLLSEEQLALYEPYLLYIDLAVSEKLQTETSAIDFPDCTKPETMQIPIPIMIDMSHCEYLTNTYAYTVEPLVFAVAVNASNKEMVLNLINFLMD